MSTFTVSVMLMLRPPDVAVTTITPPTVPERCSTPLASMVPMLGLSTDQVMDDDGTSLFTRVNVTMVGLPVTTIVSPALLVIMPDRGVPPSRPPVEDPAVPMGVVPPTPVGRIPAPPAPVSPAPPAPVLAVEPDEHDARTPNATITKK
jgi:hypothetical protein